jgi:hypothetical protein
MIKGNLINDTKTRRKSSMLLDSLSKIKYLLVLAVLLVLPMLAALPMQAMASLEKLEQTDEGTDRILAFYDTRGRESFIQVTNTTCETINIHVQIYDIDTGSNGCEECNFTDTLSCFDTHVYNIQDMRTNGIPTISPPKPSVPACDGPKTYGVLAITSLASVGLEPLIGMFRIIDDNGYEYRANTAGEDPENDTVRRDIINFSVANGHNLSDVVGIAYQGSSSRIWMGPTLLATFTDIFSWDDAEFPTSCSDTSFTCAAGFLDKGIDNSVPNSKGNADDICATMQLDLHTSAWLEMGFLSMGCFNSIGTSITCIGSGNKHFAGFVGLNNGDGTGSMDSWWSHGDNH